MTTKTTDAADAAASVQRLAVLLEAGVTPPRAWGLLADSGDDVAAEVSKAPPGCAAADVLAERGGAWGEVAVAWRVAETVGAPLAPSLRRFADASVRGDMAGLTALLAEDAELIGDGGGKVPSFGRPLTGGRRIAQLYYASHRRHGAQLRVQLAWVNGRWGWLRFVGGQLESVMSFETDGERIVRIHAQRNPDKLARIAAAWTNG